MSVANSIRIGTAAWTIPAAFAGDFSAEGSHLERYARTFNAVEINSSFYKEHQAKTYARWAAATPPGFRFSAKLSKTLTHEKRLDVSREELNEALDPMRELSEKFEILLVQLPPSLQLEPKVAGAFFKRLRASFKAGIVCEPRHVSWLLPAAEKIFSDYGIGHVWADPAKIENRAPAGDAPFYMRLHGSPQIYRSSYEDDRLAEYEKMLVRSKKQRTCWCIFDNTTLGFATGNALTLSHMMSSKKAPSSLLG